MAQAERITRIQINTHIWHLTDPQVVEEKHDDNTVTLHIKAKVDHEEDMPADPVKAATQAALDYAEALKSLPNIENR